MIFKKYINYGFKLGENRILYRKIIAPEVPADGSEEATEGTEKKKKSESIEKTKAVTSEAVQKIAGKEINQQVPLDMRSQQPEQKPSTFNHLVAAKNNIPSLGDAGRAALTTATVLVPPAAIAVAAGIGVRNVWQRIRGVPKEQRVGLTDSVRGGLNSAGRVAAAPFKAVGNIGKFAVEGTGRVLNTVVGGPIRGINKLLTYKGKEKNDQHLLIDALKGTFGVVKDIAKLPVHIVKGAVKGLTNLADDLGDHPIRSAIGGVILASGAYAVIFQGPALGAAAVSIVDAAGKIIAFIPTALKWAMGIPNIPIPTIPTI